MFQILSDFETRNDRRNIKMDDRIPLIRTVTQLEEHLPKLIIISEYDTYDKFDEMYYMIYNIICGCYEIPECISYKVKFKFTPNDNEIYTLSLPKFILNLNAWRPLVELNSIKRFYVNKIEVLDESFIIDQMFNNVTRVGLTSRVLKILTDYGISFDESSKLIQTVIERYQEASIEFSLLSPGGIFTLENCFLNDYRNNKKIQELNNLVISPNMQTADVEVLLKEKYTELISEFAKTKNPIWYVSKAGNHIKPKQVEELFISYSQVPNVDGNVIPYTLEGNGFKTGYNSPAAYYIASTAAMLSAIMNKTKMGDAGYLSRNLVLLSRTLTLSKSVFDCGTKHLLKVTITNASMLRRLENKWFCEYLGDELKLMHYDAYKHLIGKTIYIRSLLTCACGDEVCHVCYGKDSHLVSNMPGMSIYNTEIYSEPVSQNILSTKHLLFTSANKLNFSAAFHKYFKFTSGDLFLKDVNEFENNMSFEKLVIRIETSNIVSVNDNDIAEYNTFGNNVEPPFYVYNSATKEYETIDIVNANSLFIDSNTIKLFKTVTDKATGKRYYELPLLTLANELDNRLLTINIKNNGLTDNLYAIMNLLNKNAGKYEDYNQLAQDFFDVLIHANINCRIVQSEIILNRLIRNADDLYQRPDFHQFKTPAYKILTLGQAILKMKAPTLGLSYQEVKRQLLSDELFDEKDGKSFFDPLYSTEIDTSRLKELHKKVLEDKRKKGIEGRV